MEAATQSKEVVKALHSVSPGEVVAINKGYMQSSLPGNIVYASTTNKYILKFGKGEPVITRPSRDEAPDMHDIDLDKVSEVFLSQLVFHLDICQIVHTIDR